MEQERERTMKNRWHVLEHSQVTKIVELQEYEVCLTFKSMTLVHKVTQKISKVQQ